MQIAPRAVKSFAETFRNEPASIPFHENRHRAFAEMHRLFERVHPALLVFGGQRNPVDQDPQRSGDRPLDEFPGQLHCPAFEVQAKQPESHQSLFHLIGMDLLGEGQRKSHHRPLFREAIQ
jgi:hypothetical protein